jgi:hypothetical protein
LRKTFVGTRILRITIQILLNAVDLNSRVTRQIFFLRWGGSMAMHLLYNFLLLIAALLVMSSAQPYEVWNQYASATCSGSPDGINYRSTPCEIGTYGCTQPFASGSEFTSCVNTPPSIPQGWVVARQYGQQNCTGELLIGNVPSGVCIQNTTVRFSSSLSLFSSSVSLSLCW